MEGHPEERISSFIDNELTGAERLSVEEHLGSCSRCRELAADLSAVKNQVHLFYNAVEVPAALEQRVLSALPYATSRLTAAAFLLVITLSLASLAFLAAVALKPLSSALGILLHLFRVGQLVITSDPNMSGGLLLSSVFLLLTTAWSLKYLLAMEETG